MCLFLCRYQAVLILWLCGKKKRKDTQSKIKQKIQGTNSDRKETRTQISDLEQKEEIIIHPDQNEETRIQKK